MTNNINSYSNFYKYYDAYMSNADYENWLSYLKYLSGVNCWQNKKILDIACGTGNILVPFLIDTNASFFGIDSDEGMLSIADKKLFNIKPSLRQKVHLINADMTKFSINTKFDFVYSTGDSINYIDNIENLFTFLKNVNFMQKENSIFTFDILNEDYDYNLNVNEVYNKIKYQVKRETEIVDSKKYLMTTVKIDNKIKANHKQRIYKKEELELVSQKADYKKITFYNFLSSDKISVKHTPEKIQVVLQK